MQPRGNALLVGVGGSGRKSLSRLATYVADQRCFSIEISKGYRITEFREDLKTLYRQVLHLHINCTHSLMPSQAYCTLSHMRKQAW